MITILVAADAKWVRDQVRAAFMGRGQTVVEVTRGQDVRTEFEAVNPDLVVRDATGMLFVLYRQSIPFARLLFAVTTVEELTGAKVTIEGWFRRGMRPYIEMSRLTTADGRTHRAYSRWVQIALAAACVAAGAMGMGLF